MERYVCFTSKQSKVFLGRQEGSLFCVSLLATILRDPGLFTCKSRADIAFIIDSPSKTKAGFEKEKQFIKTVVRAFDISDSGVHVNIVPLQAKDLERIQYVETRNGSEFTDVVNGLQFLAKSNRIDKALAVAYNGLISPRRGERFGAPQVLVLLTDGLHDDNGSLQTSLAQAVSPFHEAGIKIVVVGVRSHEKRKDLEKLVAAKEDLFVAENLDALVSDRFTNLVAAAACQPGTVWSFVDIDKAEIINRHRHCHNAN